MATLMKGLFKREKNKVALVCTLGLTRVHSRASLGTIGCGRELTSTVQTRSNVRSFPATFSSDLIVK